MKHQSVLKKYVKGALKDGFYTLVQLDILVLTDILYVYFTQSVSTHLDARIFTFRRGNWRCSRTGSVLYQHSYLITIRISALHFTVLIYQLALLVDQEHSANVLFINSFGVSRRRYENIQKDEVTLINQSKFHKKNRASS